MARRMRIAQTSGKLSNYQTHPKWDQFRQGWRAQLTNRIIVFILPCRQKRVAIETFNVNV